jgi:hypothetical protein
MNNAERNYIKTGLACIGALFLAVLFLIVVNGRLGNDLDPASRDSDGNYVNNGTTVQQKWGCEPDEIVYFNFDGPVECVSEEEHIANRKAE